MTALHTASLVLRWAADPAGAQPAGDLEEVAALAAPGAEVLEQLGRLTVRTVAVLGAGRPPFGDGGPVGPGALLLAAAIGGAEHAEAAGQIVEVAPPAAVGDGGGGGWADATARHGVVAPFVASSGGGDLTERLLAASPLTAVLLRPAAGRNGAGDAADSLPTVAALLARPRGRDVLTTAFAAPARDARVLAWRTRVLSRLAAESREVALGIYLAARLRHGAEWDDLLAGKATARTETVRYWAPLAALDRADRTLLRSQPFLDGYRRALDLAGPYAATAIG